MYPNLSQVQHIQLKKIAINWHKKHKKSLCYSRLYGRGGRTMLYKFKSLGVLLEGTAVTLINQFHL